MSQHSFKLKFRIDELGDFALDIVWVERGLAAPIPPDKWPTCSEDIDQLAYETFAGLRVLRKKAKRDKETKQKKLDAYYKKLVPEEDEWAIPSDSRDIDHIVRAIDKGKGIKYTCTCENYHWEHKRAGTHCKHIRKVLQGLGETETDPKVKIVFTPWKLRYKIERTLRTFDCDQFLEEKFAEDIRQMTACSR